jgi:hypothetical protein
MYAGKKAAIVSCVNDFQLYSGLRRSVNTEKNMELCPIDNTTNDYSAPSAYNYALKNKDAELFVFVHQDVVFPEKWLESLVAQIKQVEKNDKNWGVLGIMGVTRNGRFAGHIIDPHTNRRFGRLPAVVVALDEVCLIIRKSSGLTFDEELEGYHFYGADICLQARENGLKCYSIDACLTHLSGGRADESYYVMLDKFLQKWRKIDCGTDVIETTCGIYQLKKGIVPCIRKYYFMLRRKLMRRYQGRHISLNKI